MIKPRYSLRWLLFVTTLVAASVGASQMHRRVLLAKLAPFEDEGIVFTYDDSWAGKFWMRMPTKAVIPIYVSETRVIASMLFDHGRGSDYVISKVSKELREIGVTDVTTAVIRQ